MALPWKVRALLRLQQALLAVHLFPDTERLLRQPLDKRLAMGPGAALVGPLPAVDAEDRQVPTRDGAYGRVRVYRAAESTDQPLLYLHGGGFVLGGIASCDHLCRRLAAESGAVVVSVEYRLAPEHRFPGPLHDAADAAAWLRENAADLGVDPRRLVVGGDSAGGNLAAALSVLLRDQGVAPAGQLLIYPAVDLSLSTPGINAYRGVGLSTEDCRQVARAYLGDADPTDPYASPWYAELAGLPPALVVTVQHDPLHDEGAAYAQRLLEAGVPTTHVDLADHAHGSLSLPRLYRGVDELYAQISRFLRGTVPAR